MTWEAQTRDDTASMRRTWLCALAIAVAMADSPPPSIAQVAPLAATTTPEVADQQPRFAPTVIPGTLAEVLPEAAAPIPTIATTQTWAFAEPIGRVEPWKFSARLPQSDEPALAVLRPAVFPGPREEEEVVEPVGVEPVLALSAPLEDGAAIRLNSTGKAISLPVSFRGESEDFGEITIRIDADDSIHVPKAALISALKPVLDPADQARLATIPEAGDNVALTAVTRAGFDVSYDQAALELRYKETPNPDRVSELSMRGKKSVRSTANDAKPAFVSGYLNMFVGADHRWPERTSEAASSARLGLQAVMRAGNVVFENDLAYDGLVDTATCPTGAVCTYDHAQGFKRQRSTFVYDMPEHDVRVYSGDVAPETTSFQRSPDVLGFVIEKSGQTFRPGESIKASGRSSFRLERPATVDVTVNGIVAQTLTLKPGTYRLSDLPLSTGANAVELVITDDTGAKRALRFDAHFDGDLLAVGQDEWSVSGGVPSFLRDNERVYRPSELFATGFYRRGVTDEITGEAHLQADHYVVMGGLGAATVTPYGLIGIRGAVSAGAPDVGLAINMTYALPNVDGPFAYWTGKRDSFRLGAGLRSSGFRAPGGFLTTATGVLTAQQRYKLRLSASHAMPLGNGINLSLAGHYQFDDADQIEQSTYTLTGDRYSLDATLSSALTPWSTGSLTTGYSNETQVSTDRLAAISGELRVMARISFRPADNASAATTYDSLNKEATLSGSYGAGRGIGRWDTNVDVTQRDHDQTRANGSLGYYGNRADVRVAHSGGLNLLDAKGSAPASTSQRTSVTVGTALMFADGAFGIGAPVRGNGFAIIEPHSSLAGKRVTVGTDDEIVAHSDFLGPAVVSGIAAYQPSTQSIDVEDAPVGYDLGAGSFTTHAPYRAGYKIPLGSAYSVTTFGTLESSTGEPIALLTGKAIAAADPARQVEVFTNGSGKFAAEGLAPGRWSVVMATDGAPTTFILEIPSGTQGLFKAGTLKPSETAR